MRVNRSTTRPIDLGGSKKYLYFAMNLRTKLKRDILADVCADIIVAAIGNVFVEVSWTSRKVTLVGFDYDLSNKYIPIVAAATAIDLPNGAIIAQLNNTHYSMEVKIPRSQHHRPVSLV